MLGYLKLQRHYGKWRAEVDPVQIVYLHRKDEWPWYIKNWPLLACPGNWDLADTEYPPFRLEQMEELFRDRIPYQETKTYQKMISQLACHGTTHAPKLNSREEIDAYFGGVATLYQSMKENGFRARDPHQLSREKEITGRIGRTGALIKAGEGTHRLALARLLKIERVSVVVDLVHTHWVQRCLRQFDDSEPETAVHLGLELLAPGLE